jgi:hypothetical protein
MFEGETEIVVGTYINSRDHEDSPYVIRRNYSDPETFDILKPKDHRGFKYNSEYGVDFERARRAKNSLISSSFEFTPVEHEFDFSPVDIATELENL